MNIVIVGAGVVGQATGKGLARLGHSITFVDINPKVCETLMEKGYEAINRFTGVADIAFFCVPEQQIDIAVEAYKHMDHQCLFVIRSTVIPGTTESLARRLNRHICFNPEFLREAVAEYEFLNPPGVIIGGCCRDHATLLSELYTSFRVPIIVVDPKTAEFTKLCINSYLACQISFWNQVKWVGDCIGVNSQQVGMLASYCDSRVSIFGARMHGTPYGGKCLPKDLEQMLQLCREKNVQTTLFEAIKYINDRYKAQEEKCVF